MGDNLHHWVAGFDAAGNTVDFGSCQADVDAPEAVILELIESGNITDSGFYFVCAPGAPEDYNTNFTIVRLNMTNPPEIIKVENKSDIFIGLAHDG